MSQAKVNELMAQYMSAEQKQAFDQSVAALPADFDNEAHNAKWANLSGRIKAALPIDPASPQAQAFLDEWDEMIRPFLTVASPEMLEGVKSTTTTSGNGTAKRIRRSTPKSTASTWPRMRRASGCRGDLPISSNSFVIPAKAGTQGNAALRRSRFPLSRE